MTINTPNGSSDWPAKTPCNEGLSAGTGAPVFKWPHLDEAFRDLAPLDDGTYLYDREFPVPQPYPTTVHYTVTLARVK